MRIVKVLAAVIALAGFGTRALAEEVVVQKRSSTAGIVMRDTISGGLLGAAVSGGIIGYQMGIQNHSDYNWQRTLAIGAGIGLGVGLIWGLIDATSRPAYAIGSPVHARVGLSMTLDVRRNDQSGLAQFPVVMGHF